ncbi:unnamed protein product, partial [Rotaria magnacalcarata]
MKFCKLYSWRTFAYLSTTTIIVVIHRFILDPKNLRVNENVPADRAMVSVEYNSVTTNRITPRKITERCHPYSISDSRPFFEREPKQMNLPRRFSNHSRYDLLRTLQSLRLVVVACAHNVEKEIPQFRSHVERIIHLFHSSSRILIFESDSTDNTLASLHQWTTAQVYTGGRLEPTIPARSERIAYCRNTLLDKARMLEPDYLLTLDMDIFVGSLLAFLTNFDYDMKEWSVMTANVGGSYYDIWALRTLSELNLNYDVWQRVWTLIRGSPKYCGESVINQVIGIHQKAMPTSHDLLEVRSAFSGAGLYKMSSTQNCQYSGENSTCEHVPFHLCIREKNRARIFINPSFRIDHTN